VPRRAVAEGPLIGGNLSLVAALLGTPWAWDARGAILFLEDVSEEPYRVDRLLTQLRLAGVLDAAAGFVLGSFTEEASPSGAAAGAAGRAWASRCWPAGPVATARPTGRCHWACAWRWTPRPGSLTCCRTSCTTGQRAA
jgi:muramoyltetrapeptide carboxypeptidase